MTCPRCGGKTQPIATNISSYGTKWYRCLGNCGKEFPSTLKINKETK
jgi:hypothetical protein